MKIYSKHGLSQTVRARELTFWRNVHPPPCVTYQVSHVMYQVSRVRCHVSGVLSQVSRFSSSIFSLFWSVGASRWRVFYQWGLPRLVLLKLVNIHIPFSLWTKESHHLGFENWLITLLLVFRRVQVKNFILMCNFRAGVEYSQGTIGYLQSIFI